MPTKKTTTRKAGRPAKKDSAAKASPAKKKPGTKSTTKKAISKTTSAKKTTPSTTVSSKKSGPGRPRKNVIGGDKTSRGPGRPPKNVILTKEEREKNKIIKRSKAKIMPSKKSSKSTKVKAAKKPSTVRKTSKKDSSKFSRRKNFALWLLIFSFALFAFSVYKAFFEVSDDQVKTIYAEQETTTDVQVPTPAEPADSTIVIESYEDLNTTPPITQEVPTTGTVAQETTPVVSQPTEIESENDLELTKEIEKMVVPPYTFTRAFEKNEENEDVAILQKFLFQQQHYTGAFNGVNNDATREALYRFQLKHNIITPEDNIGLRGYLGPSTRYKVNSLMPKE